MTEKSKPARITELDFPCGDEGEFDVVVGNMNTSYYLLGGGGKISAIAWGGVIKDRRLATVGHMPTPFGTPVWDGKVVVGETLALMFDSATLITGTVTSIGPNESRPGWN